MTFPLRFLIQPFVVAIILSTAFTAGSVSPVQAGGASIEFRFGTHKGPSVRITQHYHRHDRRLGSYTRFCGPKKAIYKARHKYGLKKVKVIGKNKHSIVVAGLKRHRKMQLRFANRRHCPIIGKHVYLR